MSVKAAISALRHDADMWDHVSQTARTASNEAADLGLGESKLSWAGAVTGLVDTYAEIQGKVEMLLREATSAYSDLSVALDNVASAYERNDENAARQFKGVWDVRGQRNH